MLTKTQEHLRIEEGKNDVIPPWQKWGPYIAERSWGTVREDYSWNGDAWNFFPFEDAHKKAYRWGEDGIAGWCDRYQVLAFSPAFWNGKDPILKERLFGLTSPQGNHGEDVKEYYYYLDGTPSHSYMKYLYKYPQEAFPYEQLKEINAKRGTLDPEFELFDTGIFGEQKYFDIFIEYAKVSPEDICIRIQAFNRGKANAPLHIIPQLWFRNQWAWWDMRLPEPSITNDSKNQKNLCLLADDSKLLSPPHLGFEYHLGKRYLYASQGGIPLFTNNESRMPAQDYFKDGLHRKIIQKENSINPAETGTKAGIHYFFESVPAEGSVTVYLRLTPTPISNPLEGIDALIETRKKEADEFYQALHPKNATEEECLIQRQALAGMLWTKQFYFFDVNVWLEGDSTYAIPPQGRENIRNKHWRHLNSMRVLSMPDKWEYPWFAAWDLSFHCLALGLVDIHFAKEQLWLLLFDQFQHPNGAIPAYEWEFSDLNPPVQAWAAYRLYQMEKEHWGTEDRAFLEKCFLKLLMNFAFWVNKVDSSGSNVFEGGFLGLDNISLVDRSVDLGGGATLKQSDGTGWMAMFCLNLMRIALELAVIDPTYEIMATKFFQHFVYVAHAMKNMGNKKYSLWCNDDGFFHDILVFPDGNFSRFKVRSFVGLIPLFAVEVINEKELDRFPEFKRNFIWFLKNRKILTQDCAIPHKGNYLLTLVNEAQLHSVLRYVWDPEEFRSEFGIRSVSKFHAKNPFYFRDMQVVYEPGEAIVRIKGGNSNWRGPIWFPTNYLLLDSLRKFAQALGNDFNVKIAKEKPITLEKLNEQLTQKLIALFTKDKKGKRPFFGSSSMNEDPHFRDYLFFNEYFHGDTGKGLGALHQNGWTGLVANLIAERAREL